MNKLYLEVDGTRPRGRPRKNWLEVVKSDMKGMGLLPSKCRCSRLLCLMEENCG